MSWDELGRLGGYRVLRRLWAGGMGLVFEAEDPQLKRLVALKVMKPALAASDSARRRFLREAQAMAGRKGTRNVDGRLCSAPRWRCCCCWRGSW